MPAPPDPKRESILSAAQVQFSRYGFRRTSMEDIARETGVSRASLYSYFENKEEIFQSLSIALHEEALGSAEGILKDETGRTNLEERVEGALAAKVGRMHEIVAESPHGSEIMDENSRLCGDVVSSPATRFQEMLASAIKAGARAGEVDLKAAGLTASAAAELLRLSAAGGRPKGVPRPTAQVRPSVLRWPGLSPDRPFTRGKNTGRTTSWSSSASP
jgi:AcrR family transcriptional regulator